MAVYQRGLKGKWWFKFECRGQTYRKAVPEARTKRQAEAAEAAARDAVFNNRWRRAEGTTPLMRFADGDYMTWAKQAKRSWQTDRAHLNLMRPFFRNRTLGDITPMLVEQFKRHLMQSETNRKAKMSDATVNRVLATLSRVFSLAVDSGLCEQNPVKRVRKLRLDNVHDRALSGDEERILMEVLSRPRYQKLLPVAGLAINTGLRRGEMLALRWPDVDLQGGTLTVRRESAKTDRARVVPLNARAREALESMGPKGEGRVFAGRGMGKDTLSALFTVACAEAKLPGVHLHTLRHTFATRLKDSGVDPFTIRDLLGHTTLRMTARYAHATQSVMRKAVEGLEGGKVLPFGHKNGTGRG